MELYLLHKQITTGRCIPCQDLKAATTLCYSSSNSGVMGLLSYICTGILLRRDPTGHRQSLFGLFSRGGPVVFWRTRSLLKLGSSSCSAAEGQTAAPADPRENSDTTVTPAWANSSPEQTLIYLPAAGCCALPEPTPSCLQQLQRVKTPAPSKGRCQPQPAGSPCTPSAPPACAAQPWFMLPELRGYF